MSISDSTAQRYTAQDPDVRLMLQVRDDKASAFEELVERHQQRLVSLMTHLVGRQDMAEDLAQDVFLRIYRARKRYVPGSKFTTGMYTIAHNVASNALRGLARRREVNLVGRESGEMGGNPLDSAALAASGMMPTRQLDKAELSEIVNLAIADLNERQRMAVLLNKFEHMSYEEIAVVMELSTPAIKSLLSRARANLKEVLTPYLQQGTHVTNDTETP
ncbi:MAG: sigma-70 family RNA polymerase sigma factor [Pirellulales bacterium]|nr:sigma-70 family RNA polymerase sigma factor [Pirellulales bacterium]